ncbi:hypothetical protein BDQ12DRAFT_140078 [Crucibulum laeve]|uniref:Uncharacterized protein n=1 Tax=Crucibulum laeve TaxID=68775 RepID=A0A5C3LYA4_9AGAR|nr:hypothetical protein BDQ12DRAFT_140078 [Crucibulum laeve]
MHLKPFTLGILFGYLPFACAWVDFDPKLITNLHLTESLPILSLGPPARIPTDLMNQFIISISPHAQLLTNETLGGQFAYDGDRLVAFVDAATGETRVFPNLENVYAASGPIDISRAFNYTKLNESFPADHTNISVVPGSNLVGNIVHREGNFSEQELYLTHALVKRNITSSGRIYPVCGPGSLASFGIAGDGTVRSLSYLWHPATFTGEVMIPNSSTIAYDAIKSQLEPVGQSSGLVKVDGVEVCFYDSASRFMQPVYRVWGTLHADKASNASAPAHIQGFIPIGGNSPELIPSVVVAGNNTDPTLPTNQTTVDNDGEDKVVTRRSVKPDIKVGRYVVRDDTTQWVTNANDFLSALRKPLSLFGLGSPFVNFLNTQYYWAYPYLFTSSKNSFINSVHLADTEVHGNWHFFTTEKNCCDGVSITDIPADGYGGGAGGILAYWIIHSCEVIPTITDYSAADRHRAFDDWWRIFNGLHAVVGYRTEMFIGDKAMPTFGRSIALGAPFVSSWLQAVHDDALYKNKYTYFDGNRGFMEPLGRASAVVVCGHEKDVVWQVENLGRPNCLREFWYEN